MTKTELCVLIYDDTMLKMNFNYLRLKEYENLHFDLA